MKWGNRKWVEQTLKQRVASSWYYILPTLMLTGVISVGAVLPLTQTAIAVEPGVSTWVTQLPEVIPPEIVTILKQDLSQRTGIGSEKLQIVESDRRTWPNGCLGLAQSNEFCTQMMVEGWQITLSDGSKNWAYRTDEAGRIYRLATSVQPSTRLSSLWNLFSKQKGIKPSRLSQADLPANLDTSILFQDISSGGFAGRTFQTRLLKDGRLQRVAVRPDGGLTILKTQQISGEQLRQFEQLLAACRFQQFNRLNYPATKGSADYITVTLSSPNATVRYADSIQGELPRSLQTVINSWSQLRQSVQ
jgi:hypothetical protein